MSAVLEACRRVFWWEGVLLLVSGALMMLRPEFVLQSQGIPADSTIAKGNLAQFGSMCLLMAYVGIFAPVVKQVVQACLMADFLWLAAFVPLVLAEGDWSTPGSLFSVWSVVFLASVRIVYLLNLRSVAAVSLHRD